MPEESLREIIGLAKKAKWIQIKKFIKFIIGKTLKKEVGYRLTALDVSINGKNKSKYSTLIKTKENIKEIDKISNFSHLSFYQATHSLNNLIDITQNNGTIIILAKYLGPEVNNHRIFDFSVHLDIIDEPFFTIGCGRKINGSEILEIINNNTKPIINSKKETPKQKSEQAKEPEIKNIETFVFGKITNKNALWNGTETKAFQNWKAKIQNRYRIETGKIPYYKGKPTKGFSLYLKNLINKTPAKNTQLIKKSDKNVLGSKEQSKKPIEEKIFEILTGKKAIWNESETKTFQKWKAKMINQYRTEMGKSAYYKGKPTKQFSLYLEILSTKRPVKNKKQIKKPEKNKPKPKMQPKEIIEQKIFETLTSKNAMWNEAETKNFKDWKNRFYKIYSKDTGKNPYYKGNLTQNYQKFLKNLLKSNYKL